MGSEPSNLHAEPRNHSRHAMPRPLAYPRRTDLCDVKACAHPPGNTALTTEYWRSCKYADDAALTTLEKAFLYTMYQLRVAGDAVRTVFSVSRRPLQALEGCLARCCCSTMPTTLRGCASAEGRSHMVGERKIINVKNFPRKRSQILYLRKDRAGYKGVSRSVKHLAARPPGWYRFRDGGVATIIRPRFITTCFVRRSNVAQAPTYITVVEGLGLSPYNLLVEAAILKQVVCTSCFGLLKASCNWSA